MEKLNLIQSLRCDIAKLNEQKEINVEKVKELDELYENNDSQLMELKVELYDIKEEFFDKKAKKYLLLTGSFGIIFAIITFFVCNHYLIPTGNFDYISSLFISTFGAVSISVASSYYFALNNKFDNFLVKVFPKLQVDCDRISLLKNNIAKKMEEKEAIIAHQNTLNFSNHSISETIEKKKQQLDKLTNDYFDNIENNHLVDKNDNIYITQENKGKTRVRTPENK